MDHRPRHRALDQDDIATTVMPRIDPDAPPPPATPPPSSPPPSQALSSPPPPSPPLSPPPPPSPPLSPPPLSSPPLLSPPLPSPPPADSADATAIIPKFTADADQTAYIPKFSEPPAEATAILAKLPPKPPSDEPAQPAEPTPEAKPEAVDANGAIVVPLRPVRTEEGYRSVYSEYTRTTFGSVARTISRGTGEVLITFGLIVLLFAGYEVWGKSAIVDAHQDELNHQLEEQWAQQPTVGPSTTPAVVKPPNGAVIASVHIPRLKKKWAIVQGVTPADIRYAPGHYPDTALPGQVGNFSMAGHRTPAIWWDLDQLKPGDPVIIKTADTWYVYRVVGHEVVLPTAVQVVAPVPDKPGEAPTKAMLTMTTCNPKFNNYQRYVVHAELDRSQPVADGDPAELKG